MRVLLLLIAGALAACTPTRGADAPLPPTDPTRLSHEHHAQIPCIGCHRSTTRPGSEDHKPCDDGFCHKKEFLKEPGTFCKVCHSSVATVTNVAAASAAAASSATATGNEKMTPRRTPRLAAPLRAYPSDDAWQSLPPAFSHKKHMDVGVMESRVGFHVACTDCHTRDGAKVRPDHATCARCHAAEAALPNAPRMADCARCHSGAARLRSRGRLVHDDIRFDHDRHRNDRKGDSIRCEECHQLSGQSGSYTDHKPPRIEACVACHDDQNRTPYQMRMRICQTCHEKRVETLTAIAPRNHLSATERPIDHTLAFRRDHAEAAGRDAARCAGCHTQMSGNARQACDECHQTMLPADHRITWRELDHGPEAAASRDRCARCHVVEFCTACHSQRPRSHGLPDSFNTEHGRLARINPRPCVTCHQESFCLTCHTGTPSPRRPSR